MKLRSRKTVSTPAGERAAEAMPKGKAVKGTFVSKVHILLVAAAAVLLIFSLVFPVMLISGDSMEPGLNDGDVILLMRSRRIEPGDLVSFRWNDKTLLKRVIACQGDWVIVDKTGRVYVNGDLLDEPYVLKFSPGETDISYPFQVPDNSYFVMGDERISSLDSRSALVGCIKDDQIIGKGILHLWPLKQNKRKL